MEVLVRVEAGGDKEKEEREKEERLWPPFKCMSFRKKEKEARKKVQLVGVISFTGRRFS